MINNLPLRIHHERSPCKGSVRLTFDAQRQGMNLLLQNAMHAFHLLRKSVNQWLNAPVDGSLTHPKIVKSGGNRPVLCVPQLLRIGQSVTIGNSNSHHFG